MGLWDKPGSGTSLKELYGGRPFRLLGIEVREVETMYGPGNALDLTTDQGEGTESELYSGFSAGILAMARSAQDEDFPVWVRIVNKPLGAGKSTTVLEAVSDDDVAAIETALATGDDIPF